VKRDCPKFRWGKERARYESDDLDRWSLEPRGCARQGQA
jgi:hypothetical protein